MLSMANKVRVAFCKNAAFRSYGDIGSPISSTVIFGNFVYIGMQLYTGEKQADSIAATAITNDE